MISWFTLLLVLAMVLGLMLSGWNALEFMAEMMTDGEQDTSAAGRNLVLIAVGLIMIVGSIVWLVLRSAHGR